MTSKLVIHYGISYPIEDHADILTLLPEGVFSSKTITVSVDDETLPNRAFIYANDTVINCVSNGMGSAYINFYPAELKKLELRNKAQLTEINDIYDLLVKDYLPETFHLGWNCCSN